MRRAKVDDPLFPITERIARAESQLADLHEGSSSLSYLSAWDDSDPREFIGLAHLLAEGDYINFTRPANTPYLVIGVAGGLMNVDYVVDTSGRGTHTTLVLAMAAAITAAGVGGSKTIWLCQSITESDIDVGGLGTSANITIASHSQLSVVITANASEDIFKQTSSGGNIGGGLHFRNLGFSVPTSNYAIYNVDTGSEMLFLRFENCDFDGEYLARQDGNDSLSSLGIEVRGCTGSLRGFYDVAGASATYSPDELRVYGCSLTLTTLWDGGSANATPDRTFISSDRLELTNGVTFGNGVTELHFQDLFILFAAGSAIFTTGATMQSCQDFSFDNIVVRFANSSGTFCNFGSNNINPGNGLFFDGIYGYPANAVGAGGTFITVDTDWTNVYVGDIYGKDFATQYSGPLTDMDALHYHSIIRDDDNDTHWRAETSADEDILRATIAGTEHFRVGGTSQLDFFNGSILETTRVVVTASDPTVTLALDMAGGGNLTLVFSDGFTTFDTTPAVEVSLTPGGDTSPQTNYVYILQSNKTLTVSISGWPSEEHAPIAIVILQSAATTETENALVVHLWHDHVQGSDEQGHYSHLGRWIRQHSATWESGVAQTLTITANGGPDVVDFATTAGEVYQMHLHTVPVFNTDTGTNVHVVNYHDGEDPIPYTTVNDLADLLIDSAGGSMSGKYFNLVIWASVSENNAETHLFLNLPSGSYNKEGDALDDVSGFTDFTIPDDFKGTAFLISRLTLRHQAAGGGTWTSERETDLRGLIPNLVAGGGTSAITTEFADNAFKIFDESDVTKLLAFQLSGITSERTLTVPDASGILALTSQSDGTIDHGTLPSYTVSNDATNRTFDADAVTLHELADIVATLIDDIATLHP